jgi:DNA polymerase
LLGRAFRVTADRGKFFESRWAPYITATVHPSSLLRITEEADRHREYQRFVQDLERVSEKLRQIGSRSRA